LEIVSMNRGRCASSPRARQLGHGVVEGGVGDEPALPDGVEDLLAPHDTARVEGQVGEHVHGARLELDRPRAVGQAVEARLHQPLTEVKRLARLRARCNILGHLGKSIGPPGQRPEWQDDAGT